MNKLFVLHRMYELGLKQTDLARGLKLDKSAITYLLSEGRRLQAKEVMPLAEILQVSPMDILNNLHKG